MSSVIPKKEVYVAGDGQYACNSLYYMAGGVDKFRNSDDSNTLLQSFPHISEPVLSKNVG